MWSPRLSRTLGCLEVQAAKYDQVAWVCEPSPFGILFGFVATNTLLRLLVCAAVRQAKTIGRIDVDVPLPTELRRVLLGEEDLRQLDCLLKCCAPHARGLQKTCNSTGTNVFEPLGQESKERFYMCLDV